MKILFICGSLEPGKDGVGDYTRRLAGELIKQNTVIEIISLNDKYIKQIWEGTQEDGVQRIPVLRLPASCPWDKRLQKAKERIDSFEPEWLSLQYVAFAFNNKG